MMNFQVHLKKARKPTKPRLRFDLEKLRDPDVACTFQATTGGKLAPLISLRDDDMDTNTCTIITPYNTALTDTTRECHRKILGSPKMFSTSVMRGEI